MTFPTLNLSVIAPQVVLVVAALVILIADLVIAEKRILGWASLVAVLGALVAVFWSQAAFLRQSAAPAFQTMALADGLGLFASAAVLIARGAGDPAGSRSASPTSPRGPARTMR